MIPRGAHARTPVERASDRARGLRARSSVATERMSSESLLPVLWLLEKSARIYLVSVPYTGLPVARLKRELQPPVEVT